MTPEPWSSSTEGEQRAGEEGLPYFVLSGVLLRGPFRDGGHVVDHKQAMRAERGDRAIKACPFPARRIGEYEVERCGLAQHTERVTHPQVNELRLLMAVRGHALAALLWQTPGMPGRDVLRDGCRHGKGS